MNLIAVSSVGWFNNQPTVRRIIGDIIQSSRETMTIINLEALQSVSDCKPFILDAHVISLSAWFKKSTDGYVVDQMAVHRDAVQLDPGKPVIVDGTGYSAAAIHDTLITAKHAWFTLEKWHTGFVLICGDGMLLDVSKTLLHNFYIQPTVLTNLEVARMTKAILARAFLARWFGLRVSRAHARFTHVANLDRWALWGEAKQTRLAEKEMRIAEKWSHTGES